MRQVYIFFKIFNARQCWLPHFVRITNMNLFCKSVIKNKKKIMFTTLTKQMKNQTNFRKVEENMDLSHIYLAVLDIWVFQSKSSFMYKLKNCLSELLSHAHKSLHFSNPIVIFVTILQERFYCIFYMYRKLSHQSSKKKDLFWSVPFLCLIKIISYVHIMKYFRHFQYYFLNEYCSKPVENVSFVCTLNTF